MDKERALAVVNGLLPGTLMETLDIRYTDAGEGFLEAVMPVDSRHHQPMGILHGGATATLAESVASAASGLALSGTGRRPVGLPAGCRWSRWMRRRSWWRRQCCATRRASRLA